jgi:hypothetical protein
VGWLNWRGSWNPDSGPVIATAQVDVPDDRPLALTVYPTSVVERQGDAWSTKFSSDPVDLDFLTRLPGDAFSSLVLCPPFIQESVPAIVHLAPSRRRLYLSSTMLTDDALPFVAALSGLTDLETTGNNFIDLRQLAKLINLESLILREKTLTVAALDFVELLTNLHRRPGGSANTWTR